MIRVSTLAALAAFGLGCGGSGGGASSLDGNWLYTLNVSGVAISVVVTLGSDGTVSDKVTVSGTCKGSFSATGGNWSSTATTITVSGKPSCKGSETCTILGHTTTQGCSSSMTSMLAAGACDYKLSNDDKTLTLSKCTSGSTTGTVVWTRQ